MRGRNPTSAGAGAKNHVLRVSTAARPIASGVGVHCTVPFAFTQHSYDLVRVSAGGSILHARSHPELTPARSVSDASCPRGAGCGNTHRCESASALRHRGKAKRDYSLLFEPAARSSALHCHPSAGVLTPCTPHARHPRVSIAPHPTRLENETHTASRRAVSTPSRQRARDTYAISRLSRTAASATATGTLTRVRDAPGLTTVAGVSPVRVVREQRDSQVGVAVRALVVRYGGGGEGGRTRCCAGVGS